MTKRPRRDGLDGPMPLAGIGTPPKKQRRTPRACDRCRLKRIKCDGAAYCQPCIKSDNPCLYTHQRNAVSKNYHWQMRDVMNEALRRMYIACKSQSGFPGKMPAGSDIDDYNVPVQAILEGLGLIPSLEAERVSFESFDNFDQDQNIWHFGNVSKSAMSSQAAENIVPSMVGGPVTTSLRAQSRNSDDSTTTSSFIAPAMALPDCTNSGTAFTYHLSDFAPEIPTVHQPYQMLYQSGLCSKTPLWPGTIATPSSGSYDFSYSY